MPLHSFFRYIVPLALSLSLSLAVNMVFSGWFAGALSVVPPHTRSFSLCRCRLLRFLFYLSRSLDRCPELLLSCSFYVYFCRCRLLSSWNLLSISLDRSVMQYAIGYDICCRCRLLPLWNSLSIVERRHIHSQRGSGWQRLAEIWQQVWISVYIAPTTQNRLSSRAFGKFLMKIIFIYFQNFPRRRLIV